MATPTPQDGGPAFPVSGELAFDHGEPCYGMTLRDWFASNATDEDINLYMRKQIDEGKSRNRPRARYAFADAMLAARERKEGA